MPRTVTTVILLCSACFFFYAGHDQDGAYKLVRKAHAILARALAV